MLFRSVDFLLQTPALRRVAGHANRESPPPPFSDPPDALAGAFQVWAPALYEEYRDLQTHFVTDGTARQNFSGIAFMAATFNLGPATVSIPHIDANNLPHGWCAVTAFGDFDPDKGGTSSSGTWTW